MSGIQRHPAAIARDAWMTSEEGISCRRGEASGLYLCNRLDSAFISGWEAAESCYRSEVARLTSENAEIAGVSRRLKYDLLYYQSVLTIGDMGKFWAVNGGDVVPAVDPQRVVEVVAERDRLVAKVIELRAQIEKGGA